MRRHFLDHLRAGTVLLVMVYHVFYLYNASGAEAGVGGFAAVQYQDALLYFVYPWFMVLLFVIAGCSARYALERQSTRDFLRARTRKLLVPSTLGLFVYHFLGGLLYLHLGGALASMPRALVYPVAALSGTGPLWFIQTLWLFSMLLPLVRRLDRNDRFYALCSRATLPALLALALPVWGGALLGHPPVVTTYRFGVYGVAFLLGWFVFAHDAVQERLARAWRPLLLAAVIVGVAYTLYFFGRESCSSDACLTHPFTNAYLWLMTLALLAVGKARWDKPSKRMDALARRSFGVYITHYVVALYACWALKTFTPLPAVCDYVLALAAVLLLSPALYALLRRVPLIRWLMFGLNG